MKHIKVELSTVSINPYESTQIVIEWVGFSIAIDNVFINDEPVLCKLIQKNMNMSHFEGKDYYNRNLYINPTYIFLKYYDEIIEETVRINNELQVILPQLKAINSR